MSTHSAALLAGDGEDADGNVTIRLQPNGRMTHERLALLRAADLLVIDEYSSLHRSIVEALLRFLRAQGVAIRVLLVGDVQQIPPVVVGGSQEEVEEASFLSSFEYAAAEKMFLTKSYRQRDEAYATFVASVGDGTAPCLEPHALTKPDREQRAIALEPIKQVFHAADAAAGASRRARLLPDYPAAMERAIEWLFDDGAGGLDFHLGFRVVLCSRNDKKDQWNRAINTLRGKLLGGAGRIYHASHASEVAHGGDDGSEMAAEALGEDDMAMFQNVDHSVPLAALEVRVSDVMLLSKNIDKAAGLVKNAKVEIVELRWQSVVVRLARNGGPSELHTIGRARFVFELKPGSPLKIKRVQLPLVHAWVRAAPRRPASRRARLHRTDPTTSHSPNAHRAPLSALRAPRAGPHDQSQPRPGVRPDAARPDRAALHARPRLRGGLTHLRAGRGRRLRGRDLLRGWRGRAAPRRDRQRYVPTLPPPAAGS